MVSRVKRLYLEADVEEILSRDDESEGALKK